MCMHCRFFLRRLELNERDVVQYKSSVRDKSHMMSVLQKFEELYEKNLSFGTMTHGVDESVMVSMKSSSPSPLKKSQTI